MSTITFTKQLYFTTSTVIDWMDVFTRPVYKHIVIDSLKYCQESKGLEIYAWVLMTNHLHMIVGIEQARPDLQCDIQIGDVLRNFKKYTSKSIVKAIGDNKQESRKEWLMDRFWFRGANDSKIKNFKFWQEGNHIETINTYEFYREKLNYIPMNPVKQEIVESPEQYLYSSARNYYGEKGLLEITIMT